jgi:hypothetical protein
MSRGPAAAGRASLLLASLPLFTICAFAAPRAPLVEEAWRDASLSLFKEAHGGFAKIEGREARLGHAITLLAQQPKTAGNISAAADALEGLIAEASGDEVAIIARFYLGRLEQIHRTPVNPAAAAVHFKRLIAEHPRNLWSEQAAVKLALIELHESVSAEELRRRFAHHREIASSLSIPAARRDLHLLLADVALRFELGETLALDQLLAADQAGIVRTTAQAQIWVQIGELARRTGRNEVAREHYQKFLAAFERDNRRSMIREHLAALPSAVTVAASP